MAEEYNLVIEAGKSEKNYWRDLIRYKELFFILAWRDIKVRYKQTAVGFSWSILRPLITMVVFTVVFGKIAQLPSEGTAPYALMVFAAMLPWQFFSNALTESTNSLVGNQQLISKIYFPRLIIPASTVITSFIDLLIAFVLLCGLMVYYHHMPPLQILLLPVFILLAFLCSFGFGLYFTALNVKYRDFKIIVPFIVQLGLYISPVGFSSNVVPEQYRLLYSLNPMVSVIDGFRWCILGGESSLYLPGFAFSILISLLITWWSIRNFRKMERTFADLI